MDERKKGNPVFHTIVRIKKRIVIGSKRMTVHGHQHSPFIYVHLKRGPDLHTIISLYSKAAKTKNPNTRERSDSKFPHHKPNKPFN